MAQDNHNKEFLKIKIYVETLKLKKQLNLLQSCHFLQDENINIVVKNWSGSVVTTQSWGLLLNKNGSIDRSMLAAACQTTYKMLRQNSVLIEIETLQGKAWVRHKMFGLNSVQY